MWHGKIHVNMWRVVVEESLSVRIVDFAIASESFEGEMTNYKEKRLLFR